MLSPPKWFIPVAIVALLWNLIGCAAFVSDLMVTPEEVATLSAPRQAMYAQREPWALAATGVAVGFGALGSLGLILRRKWARAALLLSFLGVVAQDLGIFFLTNAAAAAGSEAIILQVIVLIVSYALVRLGNTAVSRVWIGKSAA